MLHSRSSPSCLDDTVSTLLLSLLTTSSHLIMSNNKMMVLVSNNEMTDSTSLQRQEDGTPLLSPHYGDEQGTHYFCHIMMTRCTATPLLSSLFLPCHSNKQGTHHLPLSPHHDNNCPPTLHIHQLTTSRHLRMCPITTRTHSRWSHSPSCPFTPPNPDCTQPNLSHQLTHCCCPPVCQLAWGAKAVAEVQMSESGGVQTCLECSGSAKSLCTGSHSQAIPGVLGHLQNLLEPMPFVMGFCHPWKEYRFWWVESAWNFFTCRKHVYITTILHAIFTSLPFF